MEVLTDNRIQTINPTTGETLEQYELMNEKEATAAVQRCHEAFKKWRLQTPEQRAKIIAAIGEQLQANADELARLMTQEMGKLLKQSHQELELCQGICTYTAEHAPSQLQNEERQLSGGGRGIVAYRPIGVVYGIQPWNFPVYQVVRYAVANLMAGNGVLLKHAESVTGCGLRIKELFEAAGLPKDLFTVLVIDHDTSDKIIAHDLVRGVTLTGSPEAGRIVGKKATAALKKTVLELGSNDAYVVLADADIENAVEQCVRGRLFNNGQTCVAAKRFVVVADVYEDFKKAFVKAMKAAKYGDPTDEAAKIGPMAREDLREELHEQLQESLRKGATLLCGGELPDGPGFYYPATVIENVDPGQPAYDDELFGPVAALIKAKNTEDAMRIANDSRYGLGGGIFSQDEEKAIE
ncbi:MAG: NAD-dependent succinate-semialdehyde dehydrogenase, partial [Bacteroidota bacterium]